MRVVALHGLPTSPGVWARLPSPVEAPALRGVATPEARADWTLEGFVREVLPLLDADTVLVGHDLGGVVAAMAAVRTRVRMLVLTGTALGPYWAPVRLTARAPFHRYFYERHAGRKFLAGAVSAARRDEVLAAFSPVPDLAGRMRAIAREMRPPPGLARAVRERVPTRLVWGRADRWYPPPVARAVARGVGGDIAWVDGGHLCMWENPAGFAAALRAVTA
ncbi:MAG: alpha/beta fold hydrolase [Myxococcota bacterium]